MPPDLGWTAGPGARIIQDATLTIEIDREDDGRFIAEVTELPGVMVYGSTEAAALAAVKALALRVLAERIEHGETGRADTNAITFTEHRAA